MGRTRLSRLVSRSEFVWRPSLCCHSSLGFGLRFLDPLIDRMQEAFQVHVFTPEVDCLHGLPREVQRTPQASQYKRSGQWPCGVSSVCVNHKLQKQPES